MIKDTIEVLEEYMAVYDVGFEEAIRDWDEPWSYDYLSDLISHYTGRAPSSEHVCKLAGVSPKYWDDFKIGRLP